MCANKGRKLADSIAKSLNVFNVDPDVKNPFIQPVDKKRPQPEVAALISHEQARKSLGRLVHDAYRRKPDERRRSTFSIPVRDSDDDVLLMAYIAQQEMRERLKR